MLKLTLEKDDNIIGEIRGKRFDSCNSILQAYTKEGFMNILIAEDNIPLSENIKEAFLMSGFHATTVTDGKKALNAIYEYTYDLFVLDIQLPEIDGFEIMDFIKGKNIPVIVITGRGALKDKLYGFQLGAEDYLTKPFDLKELIARTEVILNRHKEKEVIQEYHYRDYELDMGRNIIKRNGKIFDLTPMEFQLASFFVLHQGIVVNRKRLLNIIWGFENFGKTKTLDCHIGLIRRKLHWRKYLVTVQKVGYKLISENE